MQRHTHVEYVISFSYEFRDTIPSLVTLCYERLLKKLENAVTTRFPYRRFEFVNNRMVLSTRVVRFISKHFYSKESFVSHEILLYYSMKIAV